MPFNARTSPELLELLNSGKRYKLKKGQVIQSTEDRRVFSLIEDGFVKRYLIGSDGTIGVQVIYGPGDIFPITLAFNVLIGMEISESKEVYYYEAMTPAEIKTIPAEKLAEAIEKNPLLYKDLLVIAGKRLHSTLDGLENLTVRGSYKRIAHQLAYLGLRFGEQTARGTKLTLPLTNQDLADILSLTRETVSAGIVKLRSKKLIKRGKLIVIPDIDKLLDEALG